MKKREKQIRYISHYDNSALNLSNKLFLAFQKDLELERKVLNWILSIVHEEPSTDFDRFIQDGSILSKVMTSIVFNSVPLDSIDDNWGVHPALDRVKTVIREIRRYGVVEVFEPEDLIELRNIPKVTKCLAQLSKLVISLFNLLISIYCLFFFIIFRQRQIKILFLTRCLKT